VNFNLQAIGMTTTVMKPDGVAALRPLLHRLTGDEKHSPSAYSTLDVLWVLYDRVLRVAPDTVDEPDRDRFLLSKGHGPAAYYAVLAAKGFLPEAWLDDLAGPDSRLGHHPDRTLVPGVEIGSGSLGHGLGLAVGTALGLRAQGLLGPARVFVLLGDAELDEGANSEAIAYAGAIGLAGLTAIVVDNASATHGRPGVIAARFAVEGWSASTVDGRDHDAIERALRPRDVPHVVVATVAPKGKLIMRDAFIETTTVLLDDDPRTAVVLADISADGFAPAARRHPDRVLNVGIREQLMTGVAGGLALTGLRPFVHSYAPFVIDRAYEQIKLDLGHQGVGAVLVSVGASYDGAAMGYTHMSPGDVALLDTLGGWTVHVPGHPDEVSGLLRAAARTDDRIYLRLSSQRNRAAHDTGARLQVVRRGWAGAPVVLAIGPLLDEVLAAVADLDVTVAYTSTPRPFDTEGLRGLVSRDVIVVEPYLAGTSSRLVATALGDVPHRSLHLGVGRDELRRYGSPADHARWHGLDAAGLRASISAFLR
jgi:transketolase